jgi:hypothetical protein
MTTVQAEAATIQLLGADWLHHGDCIGADAQMHSIAKRLRIKVALHPPINSFKRAFCQSDFIYSEADYLRRNHAIVTRTSRLIAAPKDFKEQLRSGTWSTIRYALRTGKPVFIVFPDGTIEKG